MIRRQFPGFAPRVVTAPRPTSAFSTDFTLTENPISEGGIWVNGLAVGLLWNNVQTGSGNAYGAVVVSGFDDDIAHLSTAYRVFAANQYCKAIVHRAGGYSPTGPHEIELYVRQQITANNARGYEALWNTAGICNIVRWNGALGDFTALQSDTNIGTPVDGDEFYLQIVGSSITVKKNGSTVLTATDSTYASGQPGLGFWPKNDATVSSFGWKSYEAGDL